MIIFISLSKHWQTKNKQKKQQYKVLRELSCWATNYRDSNIEQGRNLKNPKSP